MVAVAFVDDFALLFVAQADDLGSAGFAEQAVVTIGTAVFGCAFAVVHDAFHGSEHYVPIFFVV